MDIQVLMVILACITILAIPIMDFTIYLIISIFIHGYNPLAKEKGKVGRYIRLSEFGDDGRMRGALEVSMDEMFGFTNETSLKFERDGLAKKLIQKDKEINDLKNVLTKKNIDKK